jgi:hypothetical protein
MACPEAAPRPAWRRASGTASLSGLPNIAPLPLGSGGPLFPLPCWELQGMLSAINAADGSRCRPGDHCRAQFPRAAVLGTKKAPDRIQELEGAGHSRPRLSGMPRPVFYFRSRSPEFSPALSGPKMRAGRRTSRHYELWSNIRLTANRRSIGGFGITTMRSRSGSPAKGRVGMSC